MDGCTFVMGRVLYGVRVGMRYVWAGGFSATKREYAACDGSGDSDRVIIYGWKRVLFDLYVAEIEGRFRCWCL